MVLTAGGAILSDLFGSRVDFAPGQILTIIVIVAAEILRL